MPRPTARTAQPWRRRRTGSDKAQSGLSGWVPVTILAVLPPLAYGSGFLLWIAPSQAIYGRNLAPNLGIGSLMEPGVCYAGVVLAGTAVAVALGLRRLVPWPQWPRWTFDTAEFLLWLLATLFLSYLAYRYAFGAPQMLDPAQSSLYLFLHIAVVAIGLRRLYGLLRGSLVPPYPDRRRTGAPTRVIRGAETLFLLLAQVSLAILYGVFGPNPAKRLTPFVVLENREVSEGAHQERRHDLFLLEVTEKRVLGFDPVSEDVIEIPRDRILSLEWPRLSKRQAEFRSAVFEQGSLDASQVSQFLPGRRAIREAELLDLRRRGDVKLKMGRYIPGSIDSHGTARALAGNGPLTNSGPSIHVIPSHSSSPGPVSNSQ